MSDFLKRWEKISSWETANHQLGVEEKYHLSKLPTIEEIEEVLDRKVERAHRKIYDLNERQ